jgi:hypothetical protein
VVWHLAALALIVTLPGISFLLLVPAIVMSLCIVLRADTWTVACAAAIASAILFFPLAVVLYTALGKVSLIAVAVCLAMITNTAGHEIVARRGILLAASVAVAVLSITTLLMPPYTAAEPQRSPLIHELPEPSVRIEGMRNGDVIRLAVSSGRTIDRVAVRFDRDVIVVSVNGTKLTGDATTRHATVYGPSAEIELRSREPVEVTGSDIRYGVPPAVPATRPRGSVQSDRGDVTISYATRKF